jgi:hypothetical protein
MVRRLRWVVGHLPRAGTLRLYHPDDPPSVLPGERAVPDGYDGWIVEPVPGWAAAGARVQWHYVGRWVWAWRQLTGGCTCASGVRGRPVRTMLPRLTLIRTDAHVQSEVSGLAS